MDTVSDMYRNRPSAANAKAKPSNDCENGKIIIFINVTLVVVVIIIIIRLYRYYYYYCASTVVYFSNFTTSLAYLKYVRALVLFKQFHGHCTWRSISS